MAWTEDENRKAGWVRKQIRLRKQDAANLDAVARALDLNQSEAVAELCRRFIQSEMPKAKR